MTTEQHAGSWYFVR